MALADFLSEFLFIVLVSVVVVSQREREQALCPECAHDSVNWRTAQHLPSPLGKTRVKSVTPSSFETLQLQAEDAQRSRKHEQDEGRSRQ